MAEDIKSEDFEDLKPMRWWFRGLLSLVVVILLVVFRLRNPCPEMQWLNICKVNRALYLVFGSIMGIPAGFLTGLAIDTWVFRAKNKDRSKTQLAEEKRRHFEMSGFILVGLIALAILIIWLFIGGAPLPSPVQNWIYRIFGP